MARIFATYSPTFFDLLAKLWPKDVFYASEPFYRDSGFGGQRWPLALVVRSHSIEGVDKI
jgi:hypothetical protein